MSHGPEFKSCLTPLLAMFQRLGHFQGVFPSAKQEHKSPRPVRLPRNVNYGFFHTLISQRRYRGTGIKGAGPGSHLELQVVRTRWVPASQLLLCPPPSCSSAPPPFPSTSFLSTLSSPMGQGGQGVQLMTTQTPGTSLASVASRVPGEQGWLLHCGKCLEGGGSTQAPSPSSLAI